MQTLHTHYHCLNYDNSVELHSVTIYKYEMDLKLCALTIKFGKCITRTFLFYFLFKNNLTINLNIVPKLFITKKFYLNKRSSQK
jgi:hypothetical protein